jgi:LacI family transcriptional regulator
VAATDGPAPTMREVGAHAGVSVMTVSRALRGDPSVSEKTRKRVLAAAEKLQYRPNLLARSLRLRHPSATIGLIVTNLANPFYSQLALGVETAAAGAGMKVIVHNTADDVDREREIVNDLAAWRIEGLIVVPAGQIQDHLDPARLNGIPVVLCARPPVGIDVDCVILDDFGGAAEVTGRLLAAGHRKIGFLGPPAAWTSAERLRGFRASLTDQDVEVDERLVHCEQRDVGTAERVAREMLALADPPTALLCANNRNAIGAYRAVRGTGANIALASFDDFELADMLDVPLSVVRYAPEQIGREGARLLLDRLDSTSHVSNGRRVVLSTSIVDYPLYTPSPDTR